MMKRFLWIIGYGFYIASLTGCAPLKAIIPSIPSEEAGAVSPFPPYSDFKASIAVADFDVKAARATGELGSDLRNMLTAALLSSNRFSVVEHQAPVSAKQTEELPPLVTTQLGSNGAQKDKIKFADLIITTTLTKFNPQASGGREGLGGGGGVGNGILGGLLGASLNKALMALDIRIVDTATSTILATSRVQGQASDIVGVNNGGVFGNLGLGKALSAYANTSMEKATRNCIIEAVRYISQAIPERYYKY